MGLNTSMHRKDQGIEDKHTTGRDYGIENVHRVGGLGLKMCTEKRLGG